MIIDAHNHLGGPDKGDGAKQTPEEIVKNMDKTGIDISVVFPFTEINPGISFSNANNYIAEAVKEYPKRLIGFARLDPNYEEQSLRELDRAVERLGLEGVKLHPHSQRFTLENPYVLKILKRAAQLDVPVVFDSGKPESPPRGIGVLADLAPDAKIIMAHMRGEGYLEVTRTHENIYLGTTGMFDIGKLEEALEEVGAEKLIAGSDSPYIPQEKELEKFNRISNLRSEERELITGGNIKRLLGD